ncbi:hypothetical protein [Clostridium sp. DMHC 10]|uniref:hypothetical protein n=1 Tax=Clostridium sp. DMHC 10 TaxID=747377 RepID=UPI000AE7235F|nr:hypothetical protein [Clostridium sp. DMHC 10]
MYIDTVKQINKKENLIKVLKKIVDFLPKSKFVYYTIIALIIKSLLVIGNVSYERPTFEDIITSYMQIPHLYIYLCFILILVSFSYLFKNRGHMWFLLVMNVVLSILFVIDVWYYRGFNSFPTLYSLRETGNLDNLSSTVFSLIHKSDILFILDVFILIPYCIMRKKNV